MGTFFLVLVGTGTIMADDHLDGAIGPVGIALAFGLVVMGMIHATRHLSGAHLNPAVTIGLWSTGRFPAGSVPAYLSAQLTGAVAASACLAVLRAQLSGAQPAAPNAPSSSIAPSLPLSLGVTTSHVGPALGLLVEFVLTFALMFVILAMATDARAPAGLAPLAIGATVAFDALLGGALTGASMNPARSFGPALITGEWAQHWIYWVGPVAGALVAAPVYDWLRAVSNQPAMPPPQP
jgi:MIP family channel proteins